MKLVIGNKNYSTWSLRPWLLLSAFGLEFEEQQESLLNEGLTARLAKHSPTSKVPVLVDGALTVWDSLAICEYLSEQYLDGRGWPADPQSRATARALCCEMHAGFAALRNELPMNCRASRRVHMSPDAAKDIARIDAIWSGYTRQNAVAGPWLFGDFSIADCFFAPVALRFKTYGVALSGQAQAYADRLLHHQHVVAWVQSAKAETEVIAEDEAGTDEIA
jgi:glutathione S-transferase